MISGVPVTYVGVPWFRNAPYHRNRSFRQQALWRLSPGFRHSAESFFEEALRSTRPDVVNTVNLAGVSTRIWSWLRRNKMPFVHTVTDYFCLCARSAFFKNGKACQRRCLSCKLVCRGDLRAAQLVEFPVFISEYLRRRHDDAQCFSGAVNKRVIFNSADQIAMPAPFELRRSTAVPTRFGFIGQLSPIKGVDHLIRAFNRLPAGSAKLFVAGTGTDDYVSFLHRLAAGNDVEFLGWCDADDFYQRIDVAVVPSLWPEPSGRVPFEANAYGRAAIVSRRGGLPELVVEGQNGWIFDPDDETALIDRLADVVDRPEVLAAMRSSARKIATCRHAPYRVAAQYEEAFEEAIRSGQKGAGSAC